MKTNLRIILLCALVLTACRNAGISLTVEQEESMFRKWTVQQGVCVSGSRCT